jgi:hypothetical protein
VEVINAVKLFFATEKMQEEEANGTAIVLIQTRSKIFDKLTVVLFL